MRDIGDKILANAFQPLQFGHVVKDNDHPHAAFVLGRAFGELRPGHRGLERKGPLLRGDQDDFPAPPLAGVEHGIDEFIELMMPEGLNEGPPDGRGIGPGQHPAQRLIHQQNPPLPVQHQHPFDHVGQDALQARPILRDFDNDGLQPLGHLIERVAQRRRFIIGLWNRPPVQLSLGVRLDDISQAVQRAHDAAGKKEAGRESQRESREEGDQEDGGAIVTPGGHTPGQRHAQARHGQQHQREDPPKGQWHRTATAVL